MDAPIPNPKYSSTGIAQTGPSMNRSPKSNPGIVYQPSNIPTNPGSFKSGEQTVKTFTVVAQNGNRIRSTASEGVNPFQETGTVAVLDRNNIIIAQLGSDPTAQVPEPELQLYRGSANSTDSPLLHVQDDSTHPVVVAQFLTKVVVNSHFAPFMDFFKNSGGTTNITFYVSDGTTPNGNLVESQGAICYNGPGGQPYFCAISGSNVWVGM